MRVCVLQILLEDYFEDPPGNSLRWQRLSEENYHSDEINTCLPTKINLLIMFTIEKKGWIGHMSKPYKHVPTEPFRNLLITRSIFASHSVCTTVAWTTIKWLLKFVDEVGSTVFHRNICRGFATGWTITKADLPGNFTIFHCRMSTIQPAWPVCTTSICWHTCCWHFCSCSSHKTIPSLRELVVTQLWTDRCTVTYLSIGFTQVFIIIARIG